MIKTIIFDLGGVVVNSFGGALIKHASQILGIKPREVRKLMDKYEPDLQIGKIDHINFWQEICRDQGIFVPKEKLKDLWLAPYKRYAHLKKDMIEVVKKLKKKYIVGLISNIIEPHASYSKKRGICQFFEPCLLSNEVGLRKPDKRIFMLYLKKANCQPEEAVFIDNQVENLGPPTRLGIKTILFKDRKQMEKELAAFGVKMD